MATIFQGYLEKSNRLWTACFNPRHGLRIFASNIQYDFVVCFECNKMKIVDSATQEHWFSFSATQAG